MHATDLGKECQSHQSKTMQYNISVKQNVSNLLLRLVLRYYFRNFCTPVSNFLSCLFILRIRYPRNFITSLKRWRLSFHHDSGQNILVDETYIAGQGHNLAERKQDKRTSRVELVIYAIYPRTFRGLTVHSPGITSFGVW